MSFGFDSAGNRCIFQFTFGDDSRKATYLEEGKQVTLSTFEYSSVTDWASVVLRGPLRVLADEETTQAAGIFAAHAKIASLEVFQQPLEDLGLEWYALEIEEEHGRRVTE